jgi:hypothetical protein
MVAPKGYVHILIPRTCKWEIILKKCLCKCDQVKDLEMQSSLGGPTANDKCPYRDTVGNLTNMSGSETEAKENKEI